MPAIYAGSSIWSVRVLLVEDEPYMAEAIRDGLRLEAIAADIAGDGDSALELLSVNAYDIAVLDRDIPGPTGDEVAERIVASGSGTPILMLTAADRLDDRQPGSSSAPTTTSRSRSSSKSSCFASEH
jgi:two-component system response regulator VanR